LQISSHSHAAFRQRRYDADVKRENRANALFLVIFLVISLPGAVILFRKKLDPTSPRLDQPDPVLRQLPYMTPPPTPPQMRWMVPPRTRQWLDSIVSQRMKVPGMLSLVGPAPEWEPIISPDHTLQVMAIKPNETGERIGVLLWTRSGLSALREPSVNVSEAGGPLQQAQVISTESIPLPPDVRRELVGLGFSHPPEQIGWIQSQLFGTIEVAKKVRIEVNLKGADPLHSSVEWVLQQP
jgi:hypothetical protein